MLIEVTRIHLVTSIEYYSYRRDTRPSAEDIINFCENIDKLREVAMGITDGEIKPSNSFNRN